MAPMSKRYDERTLCPLRVRAEWWYRLPSQTRRRIAAEIEEQGAPIGLLVGEVQDRLIAKGLPRLMGTFMVAMQEGYNADEDDRGRFTTVEWTPPVQDALQIENSDAIPVEPPSYAPTEPEPPEELEL